jgi:hypothetical protein
MNQNLDSVRRYALAVGLDVRTRTAIVEGTTDVDLFRLTANLAVKGGYNNPLSDDLAIVAAGEKDRGGYQGVIREMVALRSMARTTLMENGTPKYRFMGLFDNDRAGQSAVRLARTVDTSIVEYRDVFRVFPVMPLAGNLVPDIVERAFERENAEFKTLPWEIEDVVAEKFTDDFLSDVPNAVFRSVKCGGRIHHEFTPNGKADFHRFVRENATLADLMDVLALLRAIRYYFNLPIA